MKFNIFRVLEKDDKELIHSSFLKYLLENWGKYFYNSLFKKPHLDFNIIELEKSYSKQRFDLEITSRDGKVHIPLIPDTGTGPFRTLFSKKISV